MRLVLTQLGVKVLFQSLLFWNLVDHRIIALTRYAVKEIDSIL